MTTVELLHDGLMIEVATVEYPEDAYTCGLETVPTTVGYEAGCVIVHYGDADHDAAGCYVLVPAEAREMAVALIKAADLADDQRAKADGEPSAYDKAPQTYGGGGDE